MPVGERSAQQNGWGARCPWVKFPFFAMTKAKFRWAEPYEGRNAVGCNDIGQDVRGEG